MPEEHEIEFYGGLGIQKMKFQFSRGLLKRLIVTAVTELINFGRNEFLSFQSGYYIAMGMKYWIATYLSGNCLPERIKDEILAHLYFTK